MEVNDSLIYAQSSISVIVDIIKVFFLVMLTYYTNFKITNQKLHFKFKNFIAIVLISAFYVNIKTEVNYFTSIISLIIMITCVFSTDNIGNAILTTTLSLTINHTFETISIIICFFINKLLNINNDYFYLMAIIILQIVMIYLLFKSKRLKYGISFLCKKQNNENIDILILNISVIVLLVIIFIIETGIESAKNFSVILIIFPTIMFITIQKSLQLYYKQKLLVQELEQTKQGLAEKTKEVEELEAENIKISKNAHTLTHKQKSLEHKIEEMMMKTEISKEEATEVRDRLNGIAKDLYKEKTTIELDKTGIAEIDDMLKYMQSECKKNKIDFELQLKGNIHHMTNNLIAKEDLETLLADHIKNAIIAINHTDNINRSILVRLGKIEETYGLYIYDSGIEFKQETLENLGKKPSTTHADEGGTGMGFMNTFDTLRKCNASLIIEEYNEPSKDNYTKALLIKFDNKNEFKIKSYRQNEK